MEIIMPLVKKDLRMTRKKCGRIYFGIELQIRFLIGTRKQEHGEQSKCVTVLL